MAMDQNVMTTVFWDSQSLIFINYLEKDKTVKELQHAELIDHFEDELHKSYVWRSKKHSCAIITYRLTPPPLPQTYWLNLAANCLTAHLSRFGSVRFYIITSIYIKSPKNLQVSRQMIVVFFAIKNLISLRSSTLPETRSNHRPISFSIFTKSIDSPTSTSGQNKTTTPMRLKFGQQSFCRRDQISLARCVDLRGNIYGTVVAVGEQNFAKTVVLKFSHNLVRYI